jgi:hypothetical protein
MSPLATQAAIRIRTAGLTMARRSLLADERVAMEGEDENRTTMIMITMTANTTTMSHREAHRVNHRNGQDDDRVRMRMRRCPS